MGIQDEYAKLERGYFVQTEWHVLEVEGKDRARFLHNLLSQHVEEQSVSERRWSTLLNSKGRLIGFFQVWKLEERFLLLIHENHKEEVFKTLNMYLITEDVTFKWQEDVQIVSTFVQSQEKLLEGYPYQTNKIVEENILRCSVDDFFIPSVMMILKPDQKQVLSQLTPISKDLFESIRIQSSFPWPGKDFDDPIPLEIPFMHRAISFIKGCYVGQETIARLHARGLNVSRKLLPFSCAPDANISQQDPVMMDQEGVGKVTSIGFSPTSNQKIGLAWIHRKAFGKNVNVKGQAIEVKDG
jgi:hypothetical protein